MQYLAIVAVFLVLTIAHFATDGELQVVVDFALCIVICTAIISSRIWGARKA